MNIFTHHLNAMHAADPKSRTQLRQVHFERKGPRHRLEATNGKIAVRIEYQGREDYADETEFSRNVPVEDIADALRRVPKRLMPEHQSTLREDVTGERDFALELGEDYGKSQGTAYESRWVDLDAVIPETTEETVEFGMTVELLERLVKTLKPMMKNGKTERVLRFAVNGADKPVKVTVDGLNFEKITALIMPFRLPKPEPAETPEPQVDEPTGEAEQPQKEEAA